jgi:hypothetical protein
MKRLQPTEELWLWLISHTAWRIANGSQRLRRKGKFPRYLGREKLGLKESSLLWCWEGGRNPKAEQ